MDFEFLEGLRSLQSGGASSICRGTYIVYAQGHEQVLTPGSAPENSGRAVLSDGSFGGLLQQPDRDLREKSHDEFLFYIFASS